MKKSDQIRQLFEGGMSKADICRELGCYRSQVDSATKGCEVVKTETIQISRVEVKIEKPEPIEIKPIVVERVITEADVADFEFTPRIVQLNVNEIDPNKKMFVARVEMQRLLDQRPEKALKVSKAKVDYTLVANQTGIKLKADFSAVVDLNLPEVKEVQNWIAEIQQVGLNRDVQLEVVSSL